MRRPGWLAIGVLCIGCSSHETAALKSSTPPVTGTHLDAATHLRWQNPTEVKLTNADAVAYCEDLSLGGFEDWRLPSIEELRTLITGCPAAKDDCHATKDCTHSATECYSSACEGCGVRSDKSCYLPTEIADTNCTGGITFDDWFWASTIISKTADCPEVQPAGGACFGVAWYLDYRTASVKTTTDTSKVRVRCVRDD